MSAIFIFFLLLIVIALLLFKKKAAALTILFITFVLYWLIGSGIMASWLLPPLQNHPILQNIQWKKSNAIILLGAGTVQSYPEKQIHPAIMAYGRITETAKLYLACKKSKQECKVILSGGDALRTGESEAANYQKTLISLGVNTNDCILDTQSMNTFYNAKFVHGLIANQHFDQTILVTSGYHLTRSNLYFKHFGINALLSPADSIRPRMSKLPSTYNFFMTDVAFHEYLGIIEYKLFQLFHWNQQVENVLGKA